MKDMRKFKEKVENQVLGRNIHYYLVQVCVKREKDE